MGNANVKGRPTEAQTNAQTILQIVTSVPSLLGSLYIIYHILRSKKRRSKVFSRLMLAMSSMDFIFAVQGVLSSVPCPRELPIFLASGNWVTCEISGFLGQAGKLSSILYNGGLALYFLVTIRYGWKEDFTRRRIELPIHMFCQGAGWGTAILALVKDYFNPTRIGCRIISYPPGCELFGFPCTRGENSAAYQLALFLYPAMAMFLWMVISMAMIYTSIAKTERKMEERKEGQTWRQPAVHVQQQQQQQPNTTLSKKASMRRDFATQAALYCSAFIFCWLFSIVAASIVAYDSTPEYFFPISILSSTMSSLQGFFNFLIYIRPRYLHYRRKKKKEKIRQQEESQEAYVTTSAASSFGPVPLGRMAALKHALSVNDDSDMDVEDILENEEGS